ncbi:hypothetical protein RUMHYD_00194 [Blautia hydrogenotrophica DSM 10507]|uniref:Uncharacterized protein n=1 Tax=Blautia hydrogenotrophica (strain DSM 10507 / JCM 14656 / S5a33) TaxID=476272 RepID=C0CH81_BLAHS|nr:hypothetical protein RUMHYD_00194 [Blautia hydrogenotrophica DSM 10507]
MDSVRISEQNFCGCECGCRSDFESKGYVKQSGGDRSSVLHCPFSMYRKKFSYT